MLALTGKHVSAAVYKWRNHMKISTLVMMSLLLALMSIQHGCAGSKQTIAVRPAEDSMVKDILADWPSRPKLAAYRMIGKYGMPQEATPMRLVWHNNGPWKRTIVTRREIPHFFPRLSSLARHSACSSLKKYFWSKDRKSHSRPPLDCKATPALSLRRAGVRFATSVGVS